MGICLDLSHWDYPTASTPDHFREMADAGVTDVIIGGNPNFPDEANAQIQFARDAEIYVGALYNFVYFGLDRDMTWTRFNAYTAMRNHISRVYQDCESEYFGPGDPRNTEAAFLSPTDRLAELDRVILLTNDYGRAHGVYTGAPWWRAKMANSSRYSALPLWLAHWASDTEFIPFEKWDANFGGWRENAIHQFTSWYPGLIRDRRDANHIHDMESFYVDIYGEIRNLKDNVARLNRIVAGYGYGRLPVAPGADPPGEIALTGDAALDAADNDGASLFLGLGDTQADVQKLKDAEAIFTAIEPNIAADGANT